MLRSETAPAIGRRRLDVSACNNKPGYRRFGTTPGVFRPPPADRTTQEEPVDSLNKLEIRVHVRCKECNEEVLAPTKSGYPGTTVSAEALCPRCHGICKTFVKIPQQRQN